MTRDHRITFWLTKYEQQLLNNFAIAHNITLSKSLRRILANAFDLPSRNAAGIRAESKAERIHSYRNIHSDSEAFPVR